MSNDQLREALMTRYLVGELTPDEREEVERRFMEDPAYFEELCALREQILLSYVRNELPLEQRRRFEQRWVASPAERRDLEDMKLFLAALSPTRSPAPESVPILRWARWQTWRLRSFIAFASAAVLTAVLLGWWVRYDGANRPPAPPSEAIRGGQTQATATATFFLRPENTRADTEPQANVYRIPPGTNLVTFTLTVPMGRIVSPHATLRPVRGALISNGFEVRVRQNDGSVDLSLDVPARLLPAGDYLLALSAEAGSRPRETIASRFFSIVP